MSPVQLTLQAKYQAALEKIAALGAGLGPKVIDWENIGKHARYIAAKALEEECPKCGQSIPGGQTKRPTE